MNILMISTDRGVFTEGSAVRARMIAYGETVDRIDIIVFSKKSQHTPSESLVRDISPRVRVHSTDSAGRWAYVWDAVRIGTDILRQHGARERGGGDGRTLITCQDPFETGLAGWFISRAVSAPLHLQIHTDFLSPYFSKESLLNRIRVRIARFLLPRADGVRAVSARIVRSMASAGITLKQPAVVLPVYRRVLQAGVGDAIRAQYPQFKKIVLVVSRLEREKNIPLALRVFQKVSAHVSDAGLFIVGDGSLKERLRELARAYGIADGVVFFGAQKDVAPFYASADMLLLTSSYEGYGLVLAEATDQGLPAVSTDVGIAPDLFGGEESLVCAVGDEACLVKNTLAVLADTLLAGKVSARARTALLALEPWRTEQEYMTRMRATWEACAR